MLGEVSGWNDYPMIGHTPGFSSRAVDVLRDLLEPNGEILPVSSDTGTFFAFNCTTVADVLDVDGLCFDLKIPDDLTKVCSFNFMDVSKFSFIKNRLEGLSIFRIKQIGGVDRYFVTDEFVNRVQESGLNGFFFHKCWPLMDGVSPWRYRNQLGAWCEKKAKAHRRKHKGQNLVPPVDPVECLAEGPAIEGELAKGGAQVTRSDRPEIWEEPVNSDHMEMIQTLIEDTASLLNLNVTKDSPRKIIEEVDRCISSLQKGGGPKFPEHVGADLGLASLWGSQIVRQFGWEWAQVIFNADEDSLSVGVFSPDRSLAIHPFHFVFGCLEQNAEIKVLLSFNLMLESLPTFESDSYENLMDHVHFIVPRE